MNTTELVNAVASANGLAVSDARKVVDSVIAAITAAAVKGDEVSLAGFGKFKVSARAARDGRNPRTGEVMTIAASKKVGFTAAKALKDKLNV